MTEDAHVVCSRCGRARDRAGQRYCSDCRRKYQRERYKRMARAQHLCKRFWLSLDGEGATGQENRRSGDVAGKSVSPKQLDDKPR